MHTDYDTIAKEYQASKLLPWRQHTEAYTFFKLIGNLEGLQVLDLACGEGFYTRQVMLRGASRAVGVDISAGMIQLAREAETSRPFGIQYHVCDVLELDLGQTFDLVCASYLLNYSRTAAEIGQMCAVISKHLKPGGRFVTINSNPDHRCPPGALRHYGFTRENESYQESAEVIYRFYQEDGSHIAVTNYHLEKKTHEAAFLKAGLTDVRWHSLELSPEGLQEFGSDYWKAIVDCQPVIGISCMKPR
ncbi:MAG TPA: methyltransferase domain-containing protein [Saprospiraceae bacterium]|nr:methyltransferase domain-containing protein [Saprospiraceae bacterium]HNT20902.1 methyltransferase domain-containing protein [Saprospiraceae bacterium]